MSNLLELSEYLTYHQLWDIQFDPTAIEWTAKSSIEELKGKKGFLLLCNPHLSNMLTAKSQDIHFTSKATTIKHGFIGRIGDVFIYTDAFNAPPLRFLADGYRSYFLPYADDDPKPGIHLAWANHWKDAA